MNRKELVAEGYKHIPQEHPYMWIKFELLPNGGYQAPKFYIEEHVTTVNFITGPVERLARGKAINPYADASGRPRITNAINKTPIYVDLVLEKYFGLDKKLVPRVSKRGSITNELTYSERLKSIISKFGVGKPRRRAEQEAMGIVDISQACIAR